MTVSLRGQPWLESASSRQVIAALEAAGGVDCARYVGGCVRNALLDAAVDDIDIATQLLPEQTVAALKAAKIRCVPTGIDHGTVTAIVKGRPFEITTLRYDVETDGRHAVVAFTTLWSEDAARRDFRLNALYASGDGRLHDPTGRGIEDALAGRIVFVGDPAQRITEDYLRILRFYRFYAWYGRGALDAEGQAACKALAHGVKTLSAERVSKELLKMLAARDPRAAVQAMAQAGVLHALLPEASLDLFEPMVDLTPDAVLRLAALLPTDAGLIKGLAKTLRLSNAQRDRLLDAAKPFDPSLTDNQARIMIWHDGAQAFTDRVLRARSGGADARRMAELADLARDWIVPSMPVSGHDLLVRGVKAGPDTGRILKAFQASWMADGFPDHGHEARLDAAMSAVIGAG